MADVAHEAGVSVASVSNFLNKQPYMSEAMAARIAEAIDRLGYKVNSSITPEILRKLVEGLR